MNGSLRFAGDLSPWLVIAVALSAAIAVTWYYLRESNRVASPYSYLLPGLRASAVTLTILILAGPVWHRTQVVGTLGRVVFAVDTSESMSINDSAESETSPDRLQRALRLLVGEGDQVGWLEDLDESHHVDVYSFSNGEPALVWTNRDGDEVPAAIELTPDGEASDLAAAMQAGYAVNVDQDSRQNETASVQRSAMVLLSDGRDNRGRSPVDSARQLLDRGTSVYTIGMGSEDEPADIGIVDVIRPDSVASDGELAGDILLSQFGMDNESVGVRIESAGEVVWQQTVSVGSANQQKIPFRITVEPIVERIAARSPRGVTRSSVVMDLRAVIESRAGDSADTNNTMPFRVAASTRDRRLLILDGSSRWETRYIRNLFERDPAWAVDTVLFGPGTDMEELKRGEESGEFPDSRISIGRYDAIVLGQVPTDQMTTTDWDLVREFVSRGGGLIMLDGRFGRLRELADGELKDLIPVVFTNEPSVQVRALLPTRMGMEHPVMNLWGEPDQLAEFWESLKSPASAPKLDPQPDAEVWAEAIGIDERRSPWMVARLYGAGRIFYLSTDQTWRWRYKVADRFHARFWNQLLSAVMQPPYSANDEFVALGTDKIEYDDGESSTIRVRLQDTDGEPVGDATVDALLIADNQVVATVPLMVDDPARGTYQGQTPALATGAYDVRVRASGFDATALQASTPIWVGTRDSMELSRVSLDANAMRQVAESGGGNYLHESSADELLKWIEPLSAGRIIESDTLVWQSFYWFWAIMLLLTVEWLLRKKAGLV
ncbi:MAG: VWA domain-containing protein [Planctomycetota bacterium]